MNLQTAAIATVDCVKLEPGESHVIKLIVGSSDTQSTVVARVDTELCRLLDPIFSLPGHVTCIS